MSGQRSDSGPGGPSASVAAGCSLRESSSPRPGAPGGPAEARPAAELLAAVYDDLRRVAERRMSTLGPGQTLQATALVHEAWLRVSGRRDSRWDGRAHFFGAAARAMREILVEQARRRSSLKRGGAWQRVDPGEIALAVEAPELGDLLALDEALARLEEQDPLKARIVMLRFFAGLTMLEVAEVLGLPLVRIEREWRFARSWLQREVAGGTPDPGDAGP